MSGAPPFDGPDNSEASSPTPGSADHSPTCTIAALRERAAMLNQIRQFLNSRGYLEVETPLLSADVTVDVYLEPFVVGSLGKPFYLQTSPEFAMKRLLVAGSGSIFQITRAFRQEECGPLHNPEFTIIEWYRLGGTYPELMDEVGQLVSTLLNTPTAKRIAYRDAFLRHCELDPFDVATDDLWKICRDHGWQSETGHRDDALNFLLATRVEPNLGIHQPDFLYDYPATQAALSRIDPGPPAVGQRFELYWSGLELCNGYQELTDPEELLRRNHEQNERRRRQSKPELPIQSRLIEAMNQGLPECAGVAVGFDRLLMLRLGASSIEQVIPFPFSRA